MRFFSRKTFLWAPVFVAIACVVIAPPWFNRAIAATSYIRIADNIHVDPALSNADRQRVLADLKTARERIAALYGAPRAQPVTMIAASVGEAARLGLGAGVPGAAFVSPTGTQVVLSMANFSIDVAAHELMHAELADRLGFWTRVTRLPVWFDEGIALQLDWRRGYVVDCAEIGAQRIAHVRTLFRRSQFWDGGNEQIIGHYQAAKCAAAEVLKRHPPHSLYQSLGRLRDGESFVDVFEPGA